MQILMHWRVKLSANSIRSTSLLPSNLRIEHGITRKSRPNVYCVAKPPGLLVVACRDSSLSVVATAVGAMSSYLIHCIVKNPDLYAHATKRVKMCVITKSAFASCSDEP
ncbi:unnamed protein product [Dicrocoelium dendriticum]|nr:unnamed protein product [Dicrocoelium dendriticum]